MVDSEGTYRGLFGAFPYAFRRSDSRLFRAYVVLGGLTAVLVTILMALALVQLFGQTAGARGGSFTLSRAWYVVVALFAVAPMLAPVLLVARRHRRGGSTPRYDAVLGGAGFGFVASLFAGLVASVPPSFTLDGETVTRDAPSGLLAPLVEVLYATPQAWSLVYPLAGALLVLVAHRLYR